MGISLDIPLVCGSPFPLCLLLLGRATPVLLPLPMPLAAAAIQSVWVGERWILTPEKHHNQTNKTKKQNSTHQFYLHSSSNSAVGTAVPLIWSWVGSLKSPFHCVMCSRGGHTPFPSPHHYYHHQQHQFIQYLCVRGWGKRAAKSEGVDHCDGQSHPHPSKSKTKHKT